MAEVQKAGWWENHYRADRYPWDLGQAAPALVRWLAEADRPVGRAIVLGAGRGHDAIALAKAGYEVTAVDFSATAVAQARALAEAAGVDIRFWARDLFSLGTEDGPFDVVFEHTCFCAIDPARRADYVSVVASLLAPSGRYVAVFFTHHDEGGPPFATDTAEIEALFSPRFALERLEPVTASVPERQGLETFGVFKPVAHAPGTEAHPSR